MALKPSQSGWSNVSDQQKVENLKADLTNALDRLDEQEKINKSFSIRLEALEKHLNNLK